MQLSVIAIGMLALAAATSASGGDRFNPFKTSRTLSGKYIAQPTLEPSIFGPTPQNCPVAEPVDAFKVIFGDSECFVTGSALATTPDQMNVRVEKFDVTGRQVKTPLLSICTYEAVGLTWYAKVNALTGNFTVGLARGTLGSNNVAAAYTKGWELYQSLPVVGPLPQQQICQWTFGTDIWFGVYDLQTVAGYFYPTTRTIGSITLKRQSNGTYLMEGVMVGAIGAADIGSSAYNKARFLPASGSDIPFNTLVYGFRAFFTGPGASIALISTEIIYKSFEQYADKFTEIFMDSTSVRTGLLAVSTAGLNQGPPSAAYTIYRKVAEVEDAQEYALAQIDDSFGGQKVRDTNPKKRKRRRKNRRRRNSKKWLRRNFTTTSVP